jgi:PAS domain S-box-containing protein
MAGAFKGARAQPSLSPNGGGGRERSARNKHGSTQGSRDDKQGTSDTARPLETTSGPFDDAPDKSVAALPSAGSAGIPPSGLAALLTENGEVLAAFDAAGFCTYLNAAAARLCQQPAHALIGKTLDAFLEPLPSSLARQAHRVLSEGLPVRLEAHIPEIADWFEFRCWPQEGGGLLLHGRSISDRKRLEEQVRQSEERWQFALRGDGEAVWDFDLRGGGAFFSERWRQQFLEPGESLPPHMDAWAMRLHPDDAAQVTAALQDHIEGVTPFYLSEYRLRTGTDAATGAPLYRWVLDRGITLRDETGVPYRLSGAVTDITERKQTAEAIRRSEEHLKRLIEASPDCIKTLDLDGTLLMMSPAGAQLLDMTDPTPLLGTDWTLLIEPDDREAARHALETARRGETARFTGTAPTATGTRKWWDTIITPLIGPDGRPERLLAISRDITALKQSEANGRGGDPGELEAPS